MVLNINKGLNGEWTFIKHGGKSQATVYSFTPLELFYMLYLFIFLCSVKIYEVPNIFLYLQANALFCCSFMDAGRHKTPGPKTKDFIIQGIANSMCITFASVLCTPVSTGPDDTHICSGCITGEEAWTQGTHVSYCEKHAHTSLQNGILSPPAKAVRIPVLSLKIYALYHLRLFTTDISLKKHTQKKHTT